MGRKTKPRYPQKCLICGHTWLSMTWKGPIQCPWPGCGNSRWRLGPSYLTPNRKAQGWEDPGMRASRKARNTRMRAEVGLAELPIYVEPLRVEPLPIVVGVAVGSGEALEGPQEALGREQPPEDEKSSEGGS